MLVKRVPGLLSNKIECRWDDQPVCHITVDVKKTYGDQGFIASYIILHTNCEVFIIWQQAKIIQIYMKL